LIPAEMDERLALARRLVAEHCLYGVDKNRMAVEMAKLSLWLITLDRGRPFTFLDHALRSGDSLLGVNLPQLMAWDMGVQAALAKGRGGRQTSWIEPLMKRALHTALELRHRINRLPVNADAKTNLEKEQLQKQAEAALELVRLGADLLVGTALVSDAERKSLLYNTLEMPYITLVTAVEQARLQPLTPLAKTELEQDQAELRTKVDQLLNGRTPYHWPLEFPEVFSDLKTGDTLDNPGFNGLIGNPPFQGGGKITGVLGTDYRDYLLDYLANGKRGIIDLCAFFFLRATQIVCNKGQSALLATNTIAQGDTRGAGLDQILANGWTIPRAIPSRKWPGEASLEVAHIWLRHGEWHGPFLLEEKVVDNITSLLTSSGTVQGKPYSLINNAAKSFIGSFVLGMGFILNPEEAKILIAKDLRNKEILFPYLNGEDLNSRFDQSPSRWVINFFNWPLEKAETYHDCMDIVREKVKPERDSNIYSKGAREKWWQFERGRPELYAKIAGMKRILVRAQVSRTHAPVFYKPGIVFSNMTVVLALETNSEYSIIQSSIHEIWVNEYSSSLKKDQRYTPTDCFETFPFSQNSQELESIGENYYQDRQSIMLTRQEGLTDIYNRFHDQKEKASDIVRLRELHREMDEAVALAYGWSDLQLEHGFHPTKQGQRYTISESARREVLGRLLKLNHERHAEELLSGQHEKKKGKKAKKTDTDTPQMF
ncbi:MAG: type IIL restriction-modification enzyme MmeI, partial [Chloroflexota bacterium]